MSTDLKDTLSKFPRIVKNCCDNSGRGVSKKVEHEVFGI